MRGTSSAKVLRKSESNGRSQSRSETDDRQDDVQPSPKRAKRGKYVSKACVQCQRRKTKCDGNSPCQACIANQRDCQRIGTDMRGKWRTAERASAVSGDLASRMSRVERQLGLMTNPEDIGDALRTRTNQTHEEPSKSVFLDQRQEIGSPPELSSTGPRSPQLQVPTFSGETSIAHNLTVVEGRLEQMGVQYKRLRSASPTQQFTSRLTPPPNESPDCSSEQQTSFLNKVLDSHRIVPDRRQWDHLMHTFCDEVHVLVPFLHPPSLWQLYDELWTRGFSYRTDDQQIGSHRVQIAHVLLGLANGRCVESSILEGRGPFSAGWSLYGAARDIFGDLIDGFRQSADQILILQTVVLMVIYLFRLDAHGSAEKILALSVSHAHHIGLHRERVVAVMSPFQGEMARRLWWCIYLLDRRLAIETGRPFLTQDVNIDVGLPRNVSDEWLTTHKMVQTAMNVHLATEETSVPYLTAMASYSRVIGKVWEALYGATTSEATPSPLVNEYLEHLTTQSQKGLEKEFTLDPYQEDQYNPQGQVWWQVKQHLMMRIRWCSLYLLIRKPMLRKPRCNSNSLPEAIENEVICMRLAQRIIDDFRNVPEEHPKYTFPFLHYLTSATIIALGLIIRQPSFRSSYGALTLRAAKSLQQHCRKTWMSGKMIQTVWRLNQMADAILSPVDPPPGRASRGGSGVSAPLSTTGSVQTYGKGLSTQDLMANPNLQPPGFSPVTSMEAQGQYLQLGPAARGLYGVEGVRSYQRSDQRQGRAGPATPILDSENTPLPAPEPTSRESQVFPRPAAHLQNQTEDYVKPRNDAHAYEDGAVPSQTFDGFPSEMDLGVSLPGEMINGGMEWLQSLFSNDPDPQILPVWD